MSFKTFDKTNPFLGKSQLKLEYPEFDRIKTTHFEPAFKQGMTEQLVEISHILENNKNNFETIFVALERSGQLLKRVSRVFFNLAAAHTTKDIQQLQLKVSEMLAKHHDEIYLNQALFEKIKTFYTGNHKGLDSESKRLIKKYVEDFVRNGALLCEQDKSQLRTVNKLIAQLKTTIQQRILNEVNEQAVVVKSKEQLKGLPDVMIEAAALKANERGLNGSYVLLLQNTSSQSVLSYLDNRELRKHIYETSITRGTHNNSNNTQHLIIDLMKARAKKAKLLGYTNYASYSLETQSAQSETAVNKLLSELLPFAIKNVKKEAEKLQAYINKHDPGIGLEAWDWAYYTQKIKQESFSIDEEQLRRYFELNTVLTKGVFFAANKLFGISFKECNTYPVYHPDIRVFEVFNEDASLLGLFLFDPFARESKQGGAWMSSYVSQSSLLRQKPIVANHLNLIKPSSSKPCLLSFEEVNTMFHEFGHALHALFSQVKYPYFSGTSVPRDFVEFPSQVNEIWAVCPVVLAHYAIDYQTKEALPVEWLDKIIESNQVNQGYKTTEYLAAALLDQHWHQLTESQIPVALDMLKFENQVLKMSGLDLSFVPPRYKTSYFSHSLGGYAAAYYAYIWSEVLDADAEEWFNQQGGITRENGEKFRQTVLSKGGSQTGEKLYRSFTGRKANITPLLRRRALL